MHIIYKINELLNNSAFLGAFLNNRFFLILSVVLLMRAKYAGYRSMWMSALINIPGTLLHELMHFFVGAALNAQPVKLVILPKRNEVGDYVMGSVSFRNVTAYNAIPASLAPLLLLPIGFYLNRYLLPNLTPTFFNYIFYVLLQTIIIENSIPSRADFRIAGMYWSGIILYAAILAGLLFFI